MDFEKIKGTCEKAPKCGGVHLCIECAKDVARQAVWVSPAGWTLTFEEMTPEEQDAIIVAGVKMLTYQRN